MATKKITRQLNIYINGKEVKNSLGAIGRELGKIKGKLREANDPKEIKKYKAQLVILKKQYGKIKDEVYGVAKANKKLGFSFKKLISISAIGNVIASGFSSAVSVAKQFISSSIELSGEAKGVQFAFKKIGEEGEIAFKKIKKSTRGLLSNLEIKKSIVEFDNFNINLDESATLFEFLSLRATQTGVSVDKLKQSLVEGLSKESKLRIDNLGISTAALNTELKRTPNFVQAVANIAKKEIARAGNVLDKAASSSQQFNATLKNTKLAIGNLINKSGIIPFFQKLATSILENIAPAEKLVNIVKEEQTELNLLVAQILKTNEASDERKELIQQLVQKYPFYLKYLKNEKIDNDNLRTSLNNVNKMYVKRLVLNKAEEKLSGKMATQAVYYKKSLEDKIALDKFLVEQNLNLYKGNSKNIKDTVEETSKVIKAKINEEKVAYAKLSTAGQDAARGRYEKLKIIYNHIFTLEKNLRKSQNHSNIAEDASNIVEKEIEVLEKALGLTSEKVDDFFSNGFEIDEVTITANVTKIKATQQQIIDSRKQLKEELKKIQDDQEFQDLLNIEIKREDTEDENSDDLYQKEIEKIVQRGLNREEILVELERSKNERLKQLKDEWDEERFIEGEEKEIYKREEYYEKLEEDAYNDTELLKQLEDTKQADINAITDKWNNYRETQRKKKEKKIIDDDIKLKKDLIKAEQTLQKAKSNALSSGIVALKGFVKEGTNEYKALFIAEKVIAAGNIITNAQAEQAGYFAAYSLIPGGPAIAAALTAASKIRMFTSLGVLAANTVKGFKDGGPTGDKAIYQDEFGAVTGVVHEDEYVVPKFMTESPRFAPIVQFLETERKKELGQFYQGGYTSPAPSQDIEEAENPVEIDNSVNLELINVIQRLNEKLDEGIKSYAVRDYEDFIEQRERDKDFEQLFNNTRQQ